MSKQTDIELMTSLATRLEGYQDFMAYVLASYRRQEGLSERELASRFGISPALLFRLALCRRPLRSGSDYGQAIRRLADAVLADEATLATVLHQVEVLDQLSSASGPRHQRPLEGLLAAARDRIPGKPEGTGPADEDNDRHNDEE
ncbi:MAG TPA: hypothetical protein VJX67_12600 [Blastocatellia bacterium]|nr:hypothetical protein [Blastocatellia bacterium]